MRRTITNNLTKILFIRVFGTLMMLIFVLPQNYYAQSTGKIAGRVIEATSKTALPGANVVLLNTTFGSATDQQGFYTISRIEPGAYKLKASFLGYQEQVIDVTVQANHTLEINFSLKEVTTELEEAVVYGELTRGQAKALNEQKNAANIKNVVSSEQFKRFPDRNAAESVARIPGVSISTDQGEGELVQIRGIGPEYNSLTVNGQRIPAPDPDLGRAVGLDMLSQELMENIVVTKALTPDMDADAIGGNINFQLKQAPDAGVLFVNLGGGHNVQSSDFNKWGNDIIDISTYGGKRFFDNKLGILAAVSYYKTNRGSTIREFEYDDLTASHIFAQHSNDYDVLRERWGFNLNTEFKFDEFNRIFLNLNHNRYFDKEIRRLVDYSITSKQETRETRNRVEDQWLSTIMFGGNHNIDGIKIDYTASWIASLENMPARTYFRFQRTNNLTLYTNNEVKNFSPTSKFPGAAALTLNRIRVDDNMKEDADLSGMINVEIPYEIFQKSSSIKIGSKLISKSVDYSRRRLQLTKFPTANTIGEGQFGFEEVIVDPNDTKYLGATKAEYLDQTGDNYDASESILAIYGMTNIYLTDQLSALAGVRFESTTNKYKSLATTSANKLENESSYSNLLPSIHFTYRFDENMNLRFAYSSGISRPSYISLVPFEFIDDAAKTINKGNPDLESTTSNNFDVMFESYTSYLGLFSVGAYYKMMDKLIFSKTVQQTINTSEGPKIYKVTMPINGDNDATVYGFEIALNQKLNFLGVPFLNNFNVYANYTYTKASVEVEGRKVPLSSSPENIVNLALMYDNPEIGLSFVISNVFRDDILIAVGNDKFTDTYFKKEYHLDISVTQKIIDNFSVFLQLNNLTNQEEHQIFGEPSESYSRIQQWAKFGAYGTLGISYRM